MTLSDLQQLNEKFQKSAVQLSELIPSSGLANATAMIVRSLRKLNADMQKVVHATSQSAFHKVLDRLEEEVDEVIFVLDQLGHANKKQQIQLITDFLKEGYDLLSVYSRVFDFIIEQRVAKEDE